MQKYFDTFIQQIVTHQDSILMVGSQLLLIIVLCITAWWIFNRVMKKVEKRLKKRPFFQKNEAFFLLFRKAGRYTILILAGVGFIRLIHIPLLDKAFVVLIIFLFASFINHLVSHILPQIQDKLTNRTENKVDDIVFDLLKRFSSILIFVTAVLLALDIIGVNIMPFVAGAGVAGIAIGFAAKDTLSNLIAGILLILDRPFEMGDRIEVWSAPKNSATWGDVIDIGLRATKIRTTDNIVIVIPNNEIMMRDIVNYTSGSEEIRVRIPIGIAYDADVDKAKKIISQVSLELDWVMEDPPPKVVVKSFGESAVDLEARVWISQPRKRIDTVSYITDRVKTAFQKEGIEIPFPKRDIYIKEAK
jgi:small-conductance mechanosensitive channel